MWKSFILLSEIPQTSNKKISGYGTISTYSFNDCLMDVCCVPGTGLIAREQKEQGLCSNGTSTQRVGVEEKTENKQDNFR